MTIQLLIVDDHEMVREGLRLTFEGTDIEVVAVATNGEEAFEKLQHQPVDVALVDIRMPHADGFRFLELLRSAGLKLPAVVMHSVQDGANALRRCQQLGAKGLVTKGQETDRLIDAVHRVYAGNELWHGSAL